MKFRITPLNFATAFFLILAIYILFNGAHLTGMPMYKHLGGTVAAIFMLFALVVWFMDLIFRNFFTETKKIWIVELSFITLATIIFFIVK